MCLTCGCTKDNLWRPASHRAPSIAILSTRWIMLWSRVKRTVISHIKGAPPCMTVHRADPVAAIKSGSCLSIVTADHSRYEISADTRVVVSFKISYTQQLRKAPERSSIIKPWQGEWSGVLLLASSKPHFFIKACRQNWLVKSLRWQFYHGGLSYRVEQGADRVPWRRRSRVLVKAI